MTDIKTTTLLNKIVEYAKNIGDSESRTLTFERYIVSVIDAVTGISEIQLSNDEREPLVKALSMCFPFAESDFSEVKEYLMKKINTNEDESFIDSLNMQRCLFSAKAFAAEKGLKFVSPDIVLLYVLSEQDSYIMEFLNEKCKGADNLSTDKILKDVRSLLNEEDRSSEDADDDSDKAADDGARASDEDDPSEEKSGNQKSFVAKLTEKVKNVHDQLRESVYGQDNAINTFTTGYFQAELLSLTDKKRTRPRAIFLFAGPPGVGKTFLAEKSAEALKLPFMRFDMSEYSDKEANIEFCGSDNVYKNGKEGNVTSFVAKNRRCVLLFDEIEKAHINVIHLFLQILDAGRLRDNFSDREVSFTDAIIIFTTNAGKQLYEDSDAADFSGVTRKVILKAIQKDINPATGTPYFPAAICSRLASGNVVMFNHITARDLRDIAKREIMRHVSNFEKEIGIKVDIDEYVYTALLFAEGGAVDARTIRSRAETFFDDEIFELFRLIASDKTTNDIEDLESIHIGVELPYENKEISSLFEQSGKSEVLVFSSEQVFSQCSEKADGVDFINAQNIDDAKKLLYDHDIAFVLIDPSFGITKKFDYLNVEDIDSKARDFFWFVRDHHSDMPIYLLQTADKKLNTEERISFMRNGARGVITLLEDGEAFADEVYATIDGLHQQKGIAILAKTNKIISFETAQSIKNDGKTAEINLFDFEMTVAIDAEDSQNILSNISKPNIRFDQVIGAEDAKKELQYFVEYLKNPKKYMGTGVSSPKGVLLYGPPGTGKTMLAKAMARESDVTFITAEGNQFLKKYVGEGPEKVHEIFRTARKYAPAILFVDEIDAIAKERTGGDASVGSEATLTAFLAEMDGFKNDMSKPVFVLAATNFDVEPGGDRSLDPALMRRFDRRVYIDLPNREERIRYIRMQIASKTAFVLSEEKIKNIAIRSTGMSLAELESIFELSLRTAIRDGNLKVTDDIFEEAFETFNGGEVKEWDESQLERIARHEAGHAFICWYSGETPSYVTVVARGDHGGYMQHNDNEGKAIYTKDELLSKIRTSLGGRAAEVVYYGEKDGVSTGAGGDLASATNMARNLICAYGMYEEFGLSVIDQQSAKSGEISSKIRDAVNKILSSELQKAIKLIEDNRGSIDSLVEKLLSENHLTSEGIKAIFGERSN